MSNEGGNDLVYLAGGDDFFFGADDAATKDTVYGQAGNDELWTKKGNDYLSGGDGNDLLGGGAGNDTMLGGNGNDTLFGSSGNDSMSGGAGSDWFWGSIGNDTVTLGSGRDYVDMFAAGASVSASAVMTITDLKLQHLGDAIGEDVLYLVGAAAPGTDVYSMADLKALDTAYASLTVTKSGDDLVIDSADFGKIIAEDVASQYII